MFLDLEQFAFFRHYKWDKNVFVCKGTSRELKKLGQLLTTARLVFNTIDGSDLSLAPMGASIDDASCSYKLTAMEIGELKTIIESLQVGEPYAHNYLDLSNGFTLYLEKI